MTTRVGDGAAELAELASRLRRAGVPVATGQVLAAAAALAETDADDVVERYWRGRVCLCSDPRQLPVYDRVFSSLLGGEGPPPGTAPGDEEPARDAASDRTGPGPQGRPDGDELPAGGVAVAEERLRHRRFDRVSDEERAAIESLIDQLRVAMPRRRTRRRRPGAGGELDLSRTLDRAVELGGELLELDELTRRRRPRRLVVLLDVSGSMAAHARALLRFAVASGRGNRGTNGPGVEVFAFGTRLTRLSEQLSERDPDAAIAAAAREVVDWDGGTRIGASLDELVRRWGRRGLLRGAVVVICSDGLERGDPEALGRAVARLGRSAFRIVWVNPLAGDPRYTPTQRGMAAALPHVDVFLPGHDLASLEDLADVLARLR